MFPARFSVEQLPFDPGAVDALGNSVKRFGPAVTRRAYAISSHVDETLDGHDSRSIASLSVAMPKVPVSLQDRFVIDGDTFEVVAVRDGTRGFHGWRPGIVVVLKLVTG